MKINLELDISKEENKMYLHTQLAEGTLPDGRKFRIIDIDSKFGVEVSKEDNWTHFMFSKEAFFSELVKKIIKLEKKYKEKKRGQKKVSN